MKKPAILANNIPTVKYLQHKAIGYRFSPNKCRCFFCRAAPSRKNLHTGYLRLAAVGSVWVCSDLACETEYKALKIVEQSLISV